MSGTNKCVHLPTTPSGLRTNCFVLFFLNASWKTKTKTGYFIIASIYRYLFFGKLFHLNTQSKVDGVFCMYLVGRRLHLECKFHELTRKNVCSYSPWFPQCLESTWHMIGAQLVCAKEASAHQRLYHLLHP